MAEGNPRLLVWGANVLRLYELSEAGFVQVASTGLVSDANSAEGFFPRLSFVEDSASVIASVTSNPMRVLHLSPDDLSQLHSGSEYISGTSRIRVAVAGTFPGLGDPVSIVALSSDYEVSWNFEQFAGFTLDPRIVSTWDFGGSLGIRHLEISPDAQYMMIASDTGLYAVENSGSASASAAFNASSSALVSNVPCGHVSWTPNAQFMVVCHNDLARVYEAHLGALVERSSVTETDLGTPSHSTIAPNGKTVAISFDNGGAITTVVYRRTAGFLSKLQEITDFGQLLDFTNDGSILIDAASQRAFRSDGALVPMSFTEDSAIMGNIATGALTQAVSTHRTPETLGISFLYDGAAAAIFSRSVDIARLRFVLLSDQASFQADHKTLNDVTAAGVNEVFGSNWPQGGLPLQNARIVENPQSVAIDFDDVRRVIYGGSISARYAVIYDEVGYKPLIFIDFQKYQGAQENAEVIFSFDAAGIVVFSA